MTSIKVVLLAFMIGLVPALATAAEATPGLAPAALTDAQKTAVEEVVRDLLTKKEPEIVIKAAQAMQEKMETEHAVKGQAAVGKNRDRLYNDPDSFVGGNPKGDVTVVEFFDYMCGYCKVAQEAVEKVLAEDKNVRLVYKEFPILGAGSMTASKAAIASVPTGKYIKFHNALMSSKDRLTETTIFAIAENVGLNVEKLKKDMADEKVEKIVKANLALAQEIGARGTPTFIIGEKVFPGAVPVEQLKEAIAAARKGAKETKK